MGSSAAADSFLALDLGNHRLKALRWDGDRAGARLALPGDAAPREWDRQLGPLLHGPIRAGLCSVTPSREEPLLRWLAAREISLVQIHGASPVPFPVLVEQRASLGADRLCNAAAAWSLALFPAIVIDVGSAATLDVVDGEGSYLGGVIFPGRELLLGAMASGGERLPLVSGEWPPEPWGRRTETALQAGAGWGLLAALEGMATRINRQLDADATLVLTGGMAGELARRWEGAAPRVEADWTLIGLRALVLAGAGEAVPARESVDTD